MVDRTTTTGGPIWAGLLVLMAGTFALAGDAAADETEDDFGATLEVSINLEIEEMDPLHFGIVGRPTTGSNTIELNWQNGQVDVGGDGDAYYVDGAERGHYQVEGPEGADIEVEAIIGDFGVDGLEVQQTYIENDDSTYQTSLSQAGVTEPLRVGGVVELTPEVPTGVHTANLYITASYQ